MWGCAGSIRPRVVASEQSSLFFEPVQLDLQLADLLGQGRLQALALVLRWRRAGRKELGETLQRRLFPLGDHMGMDPKLGRQLIDRQVALDGLQSHPGLKFRTIARSLRWHTVLLSAGCFYRSDSTLTGCPVFGVNYRVFVLVMPLLKVGQHP